MKKLLCIILTLVMLTGLLAGCSKEADKFVGTWEADLDMTPMITEELGGALDGLVTLNNMIFTTRITFYKDGTYQLVILRDSVAAAFDNMIADIEEGIIKMMEEELASMGLEMSIEDALAASGMDLDALIDETLASINLEEMIDQVVEECALSGNFEAKDGKLYLSDGLDYAPDPAIYEMYTISGTTLTISASSVEDGAFAGLYPVTFTKVS